MMYFTKPIALLLSAGFLLNACMASAPRNPGNVCDIFEDRRSWYKAALRSEQRWGVSVPIAMAFIYQESRFQPRAKQRRSRVLWIFPGPRASSAYGFAQAVDGTWNEYKVATGNRGASRRNFADAVDFVGWYNDNSRRINQISLNDAENLYLAYHEGNSGYQRGSYQDKPWLLDVAGRVQQNSNRFAQQYTSCKRDLDKNWWQRLIS